MSLNNTPSNLKQDQLLQTLQTCVDDVFAIMVNSFEEATMKGVVAVPPRDPNAIRYQGEESDPKAVDVHRQVVIGFDGDARGHVILRCSMEGADTITRGLLMMEQDEELDLSAIDDALGECANMLAGSLKTKALDPVGQFTLGLPDISSVCPEGCMEGALVYKLTEGVMSVEVWLA